MLNEIKELLIQIHDSYYDFVEGVMMLARKSKHRQIDLLDYLKNHPDASSSDVLEYLYDHRDSIKSEPDRA